MSLRRHCCGVTDSYTPGASGTSTFGVPIRMSLYSRYLHKVWDGELVVPYAIVMNFSRMEGMLSGALL
jgi:hypothetical protein